jgi:hypothetical protein
MNKIDKDEQKFLNEVKEEVDNLIDKLCGKHNYDRAYFNFVLRCDVLDGDFQKVDEVVLIDDTSYGFCVLNKKIEEKLKKILYGRSYER